MPDDELKYTTKEYAAEGTVRTLQALKTSEIAINCTVTKAVIMLKNKCVLTHLSFI